MFITKEDFESNIHTEILNALTRNQDTNLDENIAQAEDQMASYLASRYKTDEIFATTGTDRNRLLVMLCKDITLYHLHSKGNPNQMPDIRVKRYDDAIKTLKDIQKGNNNPPGLPKIETGKSSMVSYGFNERRTNHY